ncbi:MAG TPA: ribosomal protein S18-alanine N-acetyltransferase [Candidatus Fimimorpha excrementavium]|nr:ribosomal protein S18-alanine N-acetyltransferase [Candidatus Fimimorpha excrementavium]
MKIERMTAEDVPKVARLEQLVFSEPWSENSLEESRRRPEYLFLVARENDAVVGYAGMYQVQEEGNITNVAVAPDFWKQGIGNTLVKTLICEAAKRHIREMTLEVRVSNRAAIRLYERNGFVSEGCRKNYYGKPKEDALIMWNRAIQ